MTIKSIHHIAILASDYQASKRFYTEVLGFTVIREIYREERQSYKLDLAVNGIYQIELFSFPEYAERPSFPEAKGLRHLAFSVDDIESSVRELVKQNVPVQEIRVDDVTKKKFCFFYDPNGQPLELYQL